MTLEVLHRALVLLGRRARRKRAEVAAAAGLGGSPVSSDAAHWKIGRVDSDHLQKRCLFHEELAYAAGGRQGGDAALIV
jgi:hypothetical protein